jgi:hypothetical protein
VVGLGIVVVLVVAGLLGERQGRQANGHARQRHDGE